MKLAADDVIELLGLQPLPGEGGYFRQTWIEEGSERPLGTAILYLVTPDSFSALHRLDADEIFHFYLGDSCEQITISPEGDLSEIVLGQDIVAGDQVQNIVPRGFWQGTRLADGGNWALVGTTMAPGYLQSGFELATINDLRYLDTGAAAIAFRYLADGA
ncbi:MAG: cupin domain-containing protein [Thermomicrobiales bacterium]|nr:cupin domain-containing protein [Thermomicrobiales bacterium]